MLQTTTTPRVEARSSNLPLLAGWGGRLLAVNTGARTLYFLRWGEGHYDLLFEDDGSALLPEGEGEGAVYLAAGAPAPFDRDFGLAEYGGGRWTVGMAPLPLTLPRDFRARIEGVTPVNRLAHEPEGDRPIFEFAATAPGDGWRLLLTADGDVELVPSALPVNVREAKQALVSEPADLWLGVNGGIVSLAVGDVHAFAYLLPDREGTPGYGEGATAFMAGTTVTAYPATLPDEAQRTLEELWPS